MNMKHLFHLMFGDMSQLFSPWILGLTCLCCWLWLFLFFFLKRFFSSETRSAFLPYEGVFIVNKKGQYLWLELSGLNWSLVRLLSYFWPNRTLKLRSVSPVFNSRYKSSKKNWSGLSSMASIRSSSLVCISIFFFCPIFCIACHFPHKVYWVLLCSYIFYVSYRPNPFRTIKVTLILILILKLIWFQLMIIGFSFLTLCYFWCVSGATQQAPAKHHQSPLHCTVGLAGPKTEACKMCGDHENLCGCTTNCRYERYRDFSPNQ